MSREFGKTFESLYNYGTKPINYTSPEMSYDIGGSSNMSSISQFGLPSSGTSGPLPDYLSNMTGSTASSGTNTDWFNFGIADKLKGANQWMQETGMIGSTNKDGVKQDGWGGLALGGASAIANLVAGMKQYGMMQDMMQQNKDQFNKNYAASKATTNARLEDRQLARARNNPNAHLSVSDYMAKNGVA